MNNVVLMEKSHGREQLVHQTFDLENRERQAKKSSMQTLSTEHALPQLL